MVKAWIITGKHDTILRRLLIGGVWLFLAFTVFDLVQMRWSDALTDFVAAGFSYVTVQWINVTNENERLIQHNEELETQLGVSTNGE